MSFSIGDLPDTTSSNQSFNINKYRFKYNELPSFLYRIEHPNTRSRHDLDNGDTVAVNPFVTFSDEKTFLETLSHHLNPRSKRTSPFLSAYLSKQNAVSWAMLKLMDDHESWYNVRIVTIDVSQLKASELPFSLSKVQEGRPNYHRYHENNNEPFFLHRIPKAAISKSETMGDIEQFSEFASFPDDPIHVEKLEYWDLKLLESDVQKQERYDLVVHGYDYAKEHMKREHPVIYEPGQKPKPPQPPAPLQYDPDEESEFVKAWTWTTVPSSVICKKKDSE